ncbi:MAG: hypothetical protein WB698_06185 [Solirubrobacteraceae bacterium]
MKKLCLMAGVLTTFVFGVTATVASAYTNEQATKAADNYAKAHYFQAENGYCEASGKNKEGEAQYYCKGPIDAYFGGEWKVNVGPYGEITYASG